MSITHKNRYDVGTNPNGASSSINDTFYDDSGTPVPQVNSADIGKYLKATATGPVWGSVAQGVAWGQITGTITDQTDLGTALDAKLSLTGSATLSGLKTFDEGSGYTLALNHVRLDATQSVTGGSYVSRVQPTSIRANYADANGHWDGIRLMPPSTPATDPTSALIHYVTRNNVQTDYTLKLPEKNGTLALSSEWNNWTHIKTYTNSDTDKTFLIPMSRHTLMVVIDVTATCPWAIMGYYGATSMLLTDQSNTYTSGGTAIVVWEDSPPWFSPAANDPDIRSGYVPMTSLLAGSMGSQVKQMTNALGYFNGSQTASADSYGVCKLTKFEVQQMGAGTLTSWRVQVFVR